MNNYKYLGCVALIWACGWTLVACDEVAEVRQQIDSIVSQRPAVDLVGTLPQVADLSGRRSQSQGADYDGEHILGDPDLLEVPQLKGGKQNYFITHYSDGVPNYSVEYDVDLRHPRWVALLFDDQTAADAGVGRSDAWDWDPKVPRSFSTETWFRGSGYSRGHMVASSDRYYSKDANKQTFYYTNVSPQLQEHNGGVWQRLESRVQSWGRDSKWRDALYVVKGGTIEPHQIKPEKVKGIIVVPEYYWMAIVRRQGEKWQGIAFWTEHRGYDAKHPLRSLTLSIDELEERTGLNFFPNLPEDVEAQVEAQDASSAKWPGL